MCSGTRGFLGVMHCLWSAFRVMLQEWGGHTRFFVGQAGAQPSDRCSSPSGQQARPPAAVRRPKTHVTQLFREQAGWGAMLGCVT